MKGAVVAIFLVAVGCSSIPGWFGNPPIPLPAPERPSGPDRGVVGALLSYSTRGTDPLKAHDYMWDWGDGTTPKWKSKAFEASHRFSTAGTYIVRVREKCPLDIFLSDWSEGKTVVISNP